MRIGIVGAGAFGTALGVALALDGRRVAIWARDGAAVERMCAARTNPKLPGVTLPEGLDCTSDLARVLDCDAVLIAIPAQTVRDFATEHGAELSGRHVVACCKGIDLTRMTGPGTTLSDLVPGAVVSVLTGPSFAADIARGLPTALTLACEEEARGEELQAALSTKALRLYRTSDLIGAELGGALKNVMAIAAGVCIGAGLGESARAALITRGFPEMQRLAQHLGGKTETLSGLSGFGDLVLTCTSDQSRNYRYGLALGRGDDFDPTTTVEGAATARAVTKIATETGLDMPISATVAALSQGETTVPAALAQLLSRPLKEE